MRASIHPFQALRPAPAAAPSVSSVPYNVRRRPTRRVELAAQCRAEFPSASNRFPAGRQSLLEQGLRQGTRKYTHAACQRAAGPWTTWPVCISIGCAWAREQTGVAGCFSLDKYNQQRRERARAHLPDATGGRLHAAHDQPPGPDRRCLPDISRRHSTCRSTQQAATSGAALCRLHRRGRHGHTVWRASPEQTRAVVAAFARIPSLYIADGLIEWRALRERGGVGTSGSNGANRCGTFIAVAFPDSQVQILPDHRTVKDLAGRRNRSS